MPRCKAILQAEFPYNISARCINKEWFKIPMTQVWEIFCSTLSDTVNIHKLQVHSFVLMSNHFHLIASTPNANISQCMHHFMHRTSVQLTRNGNRVNETFAGRHFKCILQHNSYFLNAYKYNYRNPVKAGICDKAEEYSFSTLRYVFKGIKTPFPLVEDFTFTSDPEGTLRWINTAPDEQRLEVFRNGLKHQYFKSRINKKTKKPILGNKELL